MHARPQQQEAPRSEGGAEGGHLQAEFVCSSVQGLRGQIEHEAAVRVGAALRHDLARLQQLNLHAGALFPAVAQASFKTRRRGQPVQVQVAAHRRQAAQRQLCTFLGVLEGLAVQPLLHGQQGGVLARAQFAVALGCHVVQHAVRRRMLGQHVVCACAVELLAGPEFQTHRRAVERGGRALSPHRHLVPLVVEHRRRQRQTVGVAPLAIACDSQVVPWLVGAPLDDRLPVDQQLDDQRFGVAVGAGGPAHGTGSADGVQRARGRRPRRGAAKVARAA